MHLIYQIISNIPEGKVSTYKEIGLVLNSKGYRWIGQVLKKNPYAPLVPCHRIVNSNGTLGGFALGISKKIELLEKEGIEVRNNKIIDFDKKFFKLNNNI